MKHTCPHCNSENVQAFRVVFESGTSTAVHNTAGVGVGLGSSGSIGLGVGSAQTTSTSMTVLAEKAAPPALKKIHWMIWGLLAAGVFVLFTAPGSERGTELLKLLGVATFFVLLSVYLIVSIKKWNKTEYPRLMAEWERSWLCRSCGGTFTLK